MIGEIRKILIEKEKEWINDTGKERKGGIGEIRKILIEKEKEWINDTEKERKGGIRKERMER